MNDPREPLEIVRPEGWQGVLLTVGIPYSVVCPVRYGHRVPPVPLRCPGQASHEDLVELLSRSHTKAVHQLIQVVGREEFWKLAISFNLGPQRFLLLGNQSRLEKVLQCKGGEHEEGGNRTIKLKGACAAGLLLTKVPFVLFFNGGDEQVGRAQQIVRPTDPSRRLQ